ncbi:TPA: hypothetical protein ENG04_12045 [Candidatus Poribacteria bacterium]|nr:hypothetical protein [Candidatus Poribacteria bacterium]HEX30800.1 hypothetical protein [Candidatus Poribacteria bacterium]
MLISQSWKGTGNRRREAGENLYSCFLLPVSCHTQREFERFVHGGVGHIFEIAWQMRSMERLFLDFIENQEFAEMLLDRITEDRVFMARRYAEEALWG